MEYFGQGSPGVKGSPLVENGGYVLSTRLTSYFKGVQMGRMADLAYEREQIEQEIAIARMEAAYEAVPESLTESLEIIRVLRTQLGTLSAKFEIVNSVEEKKKERYIGFAFGVAASLVAALIWWVAASHWPVLKT